MRVEVNHPCFRNRCGGWDDLCVGSWHFRFKVHHTTQKVCSTLLSGFFHSSATFQGMVSVCSCGDVRQPPIKIKKCGLFSSLWFRIYSKTWHIQSSACSFISLTPNNVLPQKAPNLKNCQVIIYNGDLFHPCWIIGKLFIQVLSIFAVYKLMLFWM